MSCKWDCSLPSWLRPLSSFGVFGVLAVFSSVSHARSGLAALFEHRGDRRLEVLHVDDLDGHLVVGEVVLDVDAVTGRVIRAARRFESRLAPG